MKDSYAIVYRCPGDRPGPPGTTFKSIGVPDKKSFENALAEGWFATLPEAAEAYLNPAPDRVAIVVEPEPADNAPPTRDEMLTKAAEIGLTVDKRWSDKTLANKIIEALEAAEAAEVVSAPALEPEAAP